METYFSSNSPEVGVVDAIEWISFINSSMDSAFCLFRFYFGLVSLVFVLFFVLFSNLAPSFLLTLGIFPNLHG